MKPPRSRWNLVDLELAKLGKGRPNRVLRGIGGAVLVSVFCFFVVMALGTGFGFAGEIDPVSTDPLEGSAAPESTSLYDRLWGLAVLYENEENTYLQRLRLKGRYFGQYAAVESHRGSYEDWHDRQARIGIEADMFEGRVTLGGSINLNTVEDFSPLYRGISTAKIELKLTDETLFTIGKHKPNWSLEWDESLKRLITFERTLLNNQLRPRKSSGLSLSGGRGNWGYQTGLFSGDLDEEFGNFDGGWFAYGNLTYDLSGSVAQDSLKLRGDYLYNDPEPGDRGSRPYRHSLAASVVWADGAWSWTNEALFASGISSDAYGIASLFSYWLSDSHWQAVLRYQYAHSDDDGLRLQGRYERRVPNLTNGGRGEDYHAIYGGLNRYLYLDKLKFMVGLEWSNMDGGDDGERFDGWTTFAGVRFYF